MAAYSAGLWQQRLENPDDDLISMLAHSKIDGQSMSFPAYIGTFILLVVAGNETTRNSISGGLLALSENPAERQKLLDDPFRFDVTRYTDPHAATQLGFGVGQHFCLGSRLAELQLKVLFEELLRRFPDIHVSGPIRRLRSNFIYGIKEMPVRYTPEA